jgi:hypothetical protein
MARRISWASSLETVVNLDPKTAAQQRFCGLGDPGQPLAVK